MWPLRQTTEDNQNVQLRRNSIGTCSMVRGNKFRIFQFLISDLYTTAFYIFISRLVPGLTRVSRHRSSENWPSQTGKGRQACQVKEKVIKLNVNKRQCFYKRHVFLKLLIRFSIFQWRKLRLNVTDFKAFHINTKGAWDIFPKRWFPPFPPFLLLLVCLSSSPNSACPVQPEESVLGQWGNVLWLK